MSTEIGFCVVYQFKVRSGSADRFRQGWTRMTEEVHKNRNGLGSRLHLADDGWWIAYAQWPNRETWERSRKTATLDADAEQMMTESVEETMPPILMEPQIDFLASP